MIIVSQDRERIVNFNNLTQIYVTNCKEDNASYFIRFETVDSLYENLGEYKTEERAKEVLQEMIEQYEYTKRLQEGKRYSLSNSHNYVYEMPKE